MPSATPSTTGTKGLWLLAQSTTGANAPFSTGFRSTGTKGGAPLPPFLLVDV